MFALVAERDELPTDDDAEADATRSTRRRFAAGAALSALALAALAGAGVATGLIEVPDRLKRAFKDTGPDGTIPEVAPGRVTLEVKQSQARHGEVGFFTAVPDGFGDGSGLPVCLVLHGASATTADYERFGFGQFLTAAVDSGVPPFVLAGADGGRSRWAGNGSTDDPQRMLVDELPAWCADRGFDAGRLALYGWSMGGYGALLAAIRNPGLFRAVAALSPAVGGESDEVVRRVGELDPARTAVWCGTADSLYDAVRDMAARIPGDPAIESYEPGAHTRGYWNRITPEAFAFIGRALAN